MEAFSEYGHAILAMAGVAVLQLILSPLSAVRKTAIGVTPGAEPEPDYDNSVYRLHRTYGNLAESIGPFVAVTLAAILSGASVWWVNLFAALFLVIRFALIFVHVSGVGKPNVSVRSFTYVAGWLMCLCLAFLAAKAVLFGG